MFRNRLAQRMEFSYLLLGQRDSGQTTVVNQRETLIVLNIFIPL